MSKSLENETLLTSLQREALRTFARLTLAVATLNCIISVSLLTVPKETAAALRLGSTPTSYSASLHGEVYTVIVTDAPLLTSLSIWSPYSYISTAPTRTASAADIFPAWLSQNVDIGNAASTEALYFGWPFRFLWRFDSRPSGQSWGGTIRSGRGLLLTRAIASTACIAALATLAKTAVAIGKAMFRRRRGRCMWCDFPLPQPASRCAECGRKSHGREALSRRQLTPQTLVTSCPASVRGIPETRSERRESSA